MTAERTHARSAGAATMTEAPVADAPPGDQPAVDQAVIEQLATITDSEGFSVLGELLNAFLGAAPARLDALDRAVSARDLAAVADQAHALTGSSASFGARGMADLCRRLRAAAEQGDAGVTRPLLGDLHAEFFRVRASLVALTGRGA